MYYFVFGCWMGLDVSCTKYEWGYFCSLRDNVLCFSINFFDRNDKKNIHPYAKVKLAFPEHEKKKHIPILNCWSLVAFRFFFCLDDCNIVGGCCGRDRNVVGFTTTYAISAYHHYFNCYSCLFMIIRFKHWYPADVCPHCKGVVS
jgi:hypothetical protein